MGSGLALDLRCRVSCQKNGGMHIMFIIIIIVVVEPGLWGRVTGCEEFVLTGGGGGGVTEKEEGVERKCVCLGGCGMEVVDAVWRS